MKDPFFSGIYFSAKFAEIVVCLQHNSSLPLHHICFQLQAPLIVVKMTLQDNVQDMEQDIWNVVGRMVGGCRLQIFPPCHFHLSRLIYLIDSGPSIPVVSDSRKGHTRVCACFHLRRTYVHINTWRRHLLLTWLV